MNSLEDAILRTLLYADVFQFPMTLEEIHRYLIYHEPVKLDKLDAVLRDSTELQRILIFEHPYIALKQSKDSISLRRQREEITRRVWENTTRYGRWLAYIPFVRMVAITGALAMRNPSSTSEDYDYFLITTTGRVWLARAFAILLVRGTRLVSKNEICPNYVLAENDLLQQRQDLYIAHEITQMIPVIGANQYGDIVNANDWTDAYLPNANPQDVLFGQESLNVIGKSFKRIMEGILSTRLGDWLEDWEFRRKQRKFALTEDSVQSAAQIDAQHVKGHFQDHGHYVLSEYQQRLKSFNLLSEENEKTQSIV